MTKRLFLLFYIFCFSCTEQASKNDNNNDNSKATTNNAAQSLPKENAMEILAGCVDNAKANLGEAKAFAMCNCVLEQVQKKYPGADSTAIVMHLSDTAEVARMAKDCQ